MMAVRRLVSVTPKGESEESIVWAMKHASKGYPGFETQDRHHQKSNTGYQWPTKRTYVLQYLKKIFPG